MQEQTSLNYLDLTYSSPICEDPQPNQFWQLFASLCLCVCEQEYRCKMLHCRSSAKKCVDVIWFLPHSVSPHASRHCFVISQPIFLVFLNLSILCKPRCWWYESKQPSGPHSVFALPGPSARLRVALLIVSLPLHLPHDSNGANNSLSRMEAQLVGRSEIQTVSAFSVCPRFLNRVINHHARTTNNFGMFQAFWKRERMASRSAISRCRRFSSISQARMYCISYFTKHLLSHCTCARGLIWKRNFRKTWKTDSNVPAAFSHSTSKL